MIKWIKSIHYRLFKLPKIHAKFRKQVYDANIKYRNHMLTKHKKEKMPKGYNYAVFKVGYDLFNFEVLYYKVNYKEIDKGKPFKMTWVDLTKDGESD